MATQNGDAEARNLSTDDEGQRAAEGALDNNIPVSAEQAASSLSVVQLAHFALKTFVENTTLRGVRKCHATGHGVLRVHWLVYLVSMTVFLCYGSYNLISEYLEFHTNFQVEERFNEATPFPSLTVCSLSPFSPKAPQLWRSGQVASPADLSRSLRRGMGKLLNQSRFVDASTLFYSDRVSTYFQHVNESELGQIGHSLGDLVPFCIVRHIASANPSVMHEAACQFDSNRLHHPEFLNCYTLRLQNWSHQVSDVSVILSNMRSASLYGRSQIELPETAPETEEQVFNVFNQATGFRIALHEPGTYPDVDTDGFTVQTGTATLIRYRTVRVENEQYPAGECSDSRGLPAIQDHDDNFDYTQAACVSSYIGRHVRESCNCISAFHIRPHLPSLLTPYCGHYDEADLDGFLERQSCVRRLNLSESTKEISMGPCRKPCTQYSYESHLSVSNWSPRLWQLRWLGQINGALKHLIIKGRSRSVFQRLVNFSQLDSIADRDERSFVNRTALVKISRLSYNTLVKQEKLQISLSALVSRIGGLGTLTIGITLTCAFELAELLFLIAYRARSHSAGGTARSASQVPELRLDNTGELAELTPAPSLDHLAVVHRERLRQWSDVGSEVMVVRRWANMGSGC